MSEKAFDHKIVQFKENLDLLRNFVELVKPVISEHEIEQQKSAAKSKELSDYIFWKIGIVKELSLTKQKQYEKQFAGKIKFTGDNSFSFADKQLLNQFIPKPQPSKKIPDQLFESSLVSLTSTVEWFFAQILRTFYNRYPETVTEKSEVPFTFKELKKFSKIEDAQAFLLDREIEKIIRSSFREWLETSTKKLHSKTKFNASDIDATEEIFLRRNLLVHNGGRVNNIYLNSVADSLKADKKLDQKLEVDEPYLHDSINRIEWLFIQLALSILYPKNTQLNVAQESLLSDIIMSNISHGRYAISENIAFYLKNHSKLSERFKWVTCVNYWQSIKWQNRFEEIKDEVNAFDCSALSKEFHLARAALQDNVTAFFRILPDAIKTKAISMEELKTWPLFSKMRQEQKYKDFLKKKKKN